MALRFRRNFFVSSLLALGLTSGAAAQARMYVLDGNTSTLRFSCDLLGMMPIEGAFTRFIAMISIDPAAPGEARAVVKVDARSLEAHDSRWLDDLKGEAFFDIERHPQFGFESFAATVVQPGVLKVRGQLTLRGVSRPVTLNVRYTLPGAGSDMDTTIEARGEVDRTDFGMDSYRAFVSDDVEIQVEGRPVMALPSPEP
jgi:polyisoprenoid-binding protein YceI